MNSFGRAAAGLSVVAASALAVGVGIGAAASEVPKITNVSASPTRFCVSPCANGGTAVTFSISSKATIKSSIYSRERNIGAMREFKGVKVHAGVNTLHLNDSRLAKIPGRWTLRLQGVNNVGAGTLGVVTVRVTK